MRIRVRNGEKDWRAPGKAPVNRRDGISRWKRKKQRAGGTGAAWESAPRDLRAGPAPARSPPRPRGRPERRVEDRGVLCGSGRIRERGPVRADARATTVPQMRVPWHTGPAGSEGHVPGAGSR
ncbi:hypothetical protein GCM10010273_41790 [Streptomyces lavendulocolor]